MHRVDRAAPEFPQASDVGAWSALTFANAFRGSFEDIQARLAVYLPDVSRAMRRTRNTAVIDIGCGRGEWLELLRGNGFNALGIDESPDAVKTCAERGLDARVGDAIESLRAQPDASVAAVTAFHVVEHIPYANVVALIVEAFRVVCPGGILIIETPNCENVVVGANGFWLDPTHIRPYPLPLLEFLVMQAGFVPVELKRLHPDQALLDDPQMRAVPEPLRAAVAGPQDGGIVAMRKAT
ncbi:MAG: class I SAM-dependent methyltransferase [Casimicrobiaceae bacterium]